MYKAHSNHGFTLIELVVTLAIAALLLAMALPSFDDFQRQQTMSSRMSTLHQDLTFARSEAVRLGGDVYISAKSNDFGNGWQVYENLNASTSYQAAQDRLLRETENRRKLDGDDVTADGELVLRFIDINSDGRAQPRRVIVRV